MIFVSRWREHSPFSKRVVTVPDTTILEWFRLGWNQADPRAWIKENLGGEVYGLGTAFETGTTAPQSMDELRELLYEHLYVEGDPQELIRLGELALRVRTDDDEVDLAYYFFDDEAAVFSADRLAFLLHDTWPLPSDAAPPETVFRHRVPVRPVSPVRPGSEAVFSVRLHWEDPQSLNLDGAMMFSGVSLPGLATHIRSVSTSVIEGWPTDAQLLRELLGSGEGDIAAALERYVQQEPHPASLIESDRHIVQVARYVSDFLGFDQWLLFDTHWAATHPDLARSLLRYAAHWDPYEFSA